MKKILNIEEYVDFMYGKANVLKITKLAESVDVMLPDGTIVHHDGGVFVSGYKETK